MPRCTHNDEYYVPVVLIIVSTRLCNELNSTHHKNSCTQLKYLSTPLYSREVLRKVCRLHRNWLEIHHRGRG